MNAEISEVCTYCIALLVSPDVRWRPNVSIGWPPEHWTDEKANILRDGPLWQRVTLIAQALALGWPVHIDDLYVRTPITTWHGDPICETHLAEKAYAR